jgi:hypothetical protein
MKRKFLYIMLMTVILTTSININLLNEEEPPLFGSSIKVEIIPNNEEEPPLFDQNQETNIDIKLFNEEEPPLFG